MAVMAMSRWEREAVRPESEEWWREVARRRAMDAPGDELGTKDAS
jgi:predicted RNA polymerase sigma factor